MYICICKAISQDQFMEELVKMGSLSKAKKNCGIGSDCGSCIERTLEIYNETMEQRSALKKMNYNSKL